MKQEQLSIAVIGAGVIGLTSAVRLLEQGHRVTVFARAIPPHTTSDVAAAYWAPHEYGNDRRRRWAYASLQEFRRLAPNPACGIDFTHLYDLSDENDVEFLSSDHETMEEVPLGCFPAPWQGVRFTVPRIDVPIYMPWLLQRFQALGGVIEITEIQNLRSLKSDFTMVVNCAGLGAKALTGDTLYPIRGQVILVRKPVDLPGDIISAASATATTYIVPRSQDCLLGGTFQHYDYNLQVDAEIAEGILQRCALFCPTLAQADILEHRVGLRPGRDSVRLEAEQLTSTFKVIHNYGHGAYGHTLSWGCADEVVRIVAGNGNGNGNGNSIAHK